MKSKLDELAEVAFRHEGLRVRSLFQELPRPATDDPHRLAIAASLIELLAARLGQAPPSWTQEIGAVPEPFFLVKAAAHMQRLRALCLSQTPEALRKQNLYAPPNYLEDA